jgi:flagellar basal body-associated protein FliL
MSTKTMNVSHHKTPMPRALLVLAACSGTWLGPPALAQENEQSTQETSSEETKTVQERLTYDLGRFQLREIRPTRNETTKIDFQAYFAMSSDVSRQDLEKLEHWKHRFRDQIIVAVRTAQTKDFQEPRLERLRRIILFRVDRMMRESVVEDILFTEFTFSTE